MAQGLDWLAAAVTFLGALGVALARDTRRAAMALLASLVAMALALALLGARELAIGLVVLLALGTGGVLHLAHGRTQEPPSRALTERQRYWAALLGLLTFVFLLRVGGGAPVSFGSMGSTQTLAPAVFALGLYGLLTQRSLLRWAMAAEVAIAALVLTVAQAGALRPEWHAASVQVGLAILGIVALLTSCLAVLASLAGRGGLALDPDASVPGEV